MDWQERDGVTYKELSYDEWLLHMEEFYETRELLREYIQLWRRITVPKSRVHLRHVIMFVRKRIAERKKNK